MEINPLVSTIISSGVVVFALVVALILFATIFAVLTTEIFGRIIE